MKHEFRLTSLRNTFSTAIMLVLLSGSCLLLLAAEEKDQGDHFTATAAGRLGGRMQLDIRIKEYTSDSETMRLAQILDLQGADQLRGELEKLKQGRISISGQAGIDISVARIRETEGGQRIVLVTARNIPFFGLPDSVPSRSHPFGWVELNLDEEGRGRGGLIVATKVWFNKERVLEMESLGNSYIELSDVLRHR